MPRFLLIATNGLVRFHATLFKLIKIYILKFSFFAFVLCDVDAVCDVNDCEMKFFFSPIDDETHPPFY